MVEIALVPIDVAKRIVGQPVFRVEGDGFA